MTKKSIQKWILILLKRIIFVSACLYLLWRFFIDDSLNFQSNVFDIFNIQSIIFLIIVLILVFFNWLIESFKWKAALQNLTPLSTKRSFTGVLFGLSVSILTPNRSGECVGRLWVLPENTRIKAFATTVVANFSQFLITIIFGIIALFFFKDNITLPVYFELKNSHFYIAGLLLLIAFLFFLFYSKIKKVNFFKRFVSSFEVIKSWNYRTISKLLIFSILRYIIFVIQFWLLLIVFQTPISFVNVYSGIGVMYLIMALLPILTIAEPAVRCELSVYLLSIYNPCEAGIMAAALVLWTVNVAIPAVIGSIWLNFYKD